MKRILILISIVILGYGCDKVEVTAPIGANDGTPAIRFSIITPNTAYPKIAYVPNGLNAQEFLSLEDNGIKVKLEAPMVAPQDIYLTYSTNPAGLTKLNAEIAALPIPTAVPPQPPYQKFTPFLLLPDSCFKILVTKDTIRKGLQYAEKTVNNIVVYASKIDPSVNYCLPFSVTSSAYPSAVGTGTIYYTIIGNPLAGPYATTGKRYNYTGSVAWSGPPAPYPAGFTDGTTAVYNGTVFASPINGLTIHFDMGNVPDPAGPLAQYYVTGVSGANGPFTNITFDQGPTFESGYSNIQRYILNYVAPINGNKPSFRLITKYNNTTGNAGNDRLIDQTFTHL